MFLFYSVIIITSVLMVASETETEIAVEELGNFLVDLDKKILRLLILPERGKGNLLYGYLEDFWKNLRYLDGLVVLSEQKAFRPAKFVVENECPSFVQEAFDLPNLQQTYGWKSKTFSNVKDLLLVIAALSQKLQIDFTKMRVDVDTLLQRPYNE
uniref:Ionotropic glutamate receptor L-glutamate and glycine-binding domain-containing protein n=1 Tax=Cuerna arida TaxID=1464854 RepID=A0A1B6H252_9HEMI